MNWSHAIASRFCNDCDDSAYMLSNVPNTIVSCTFLIIYFRVRLNSISLFQTVLKYIVSYTHFLLLLLKQPFKFSISRFKINGQSSYKLLWVSYGLVSVQCPFWYAVFCVFFVNLHVVTFNSSYSLFIIYLFYSAHLVFI